jgi:hypothetical protein
MNNETKAELVGVSYRIQKAVEDQLASLAEGVTSCVEKARTYRPESYLDSTCTVERRDAMQMVEATATLLLSIAKLKGEFRHDYRVVRVNEKEKILGAPNGRKPWNGDETQLLSEAEIEALSEDEQIDYHRWTKGLPPKFGGWCKPDSKTVRDAASRIGDPEAVTPTPLQNRGSNAGGA